MTTEPAVTTAPSTAGLTLSSVERTAGCTTCGRAADGGVTPVDSYHGAPPAHRDAGRRAR